METSSVCHGYAFGESEAIDVIDLSLAVPLVSNMDLETNSTQLEPDSVAYMHLGRREVGLSCSFARFARFAIIVFCYCFGDAFGFVALASRWFTSGSTGQPKGVLISHRAFWNWHHV